MPNDYLSSIPESEEVWDEQGNVRAIIGPRSVEPRSTANKPKPKTKPKASKQAKKSPAKKPKETVKVEISTTDRQRPLSSIMDWDDEDAKRYEEFADYDKTLEADEKGISEEEMLGLFPGVEHKGPEDFATDIAQALAGAGILRGAGKAAGAVLDKISKRVPKITTKVTEKPLEKGALDLDLDALKSSPEKQQKLFDYIKKQADEAGGKESLLIQGGEVLPSNKGKIQRIFFKEAGEAPAKSGGMVREGAEAMGGKANYNRALERLNKQLLKGDEGSTSSMRTNLQNLGLTEKEIAEILKNRGG